MPVGSVTKAIIALGAKDWNEENTIFREHWDDTIRDRAGITEPAQPFDEEMVGINGPARQAHEKFIIRSYRKAGLQANRKAVEDTMAVAVLTYVNKVLLRVLTNRYAKKSPRTLATLAPRLKGLL